MNKSRIKRWWVHLRRLLVVAFALLVLGLLVRHARSIDWRQVADALAAYQVSTLLLAATVAAASHLLYSTFDLIGRRYVGHDLPARRTMAIAFVSYAFNLNLGALVGGVAFRYRLYSRYHLRGRTITRILGLSMTTNWLGYMLLAGIAFSVERLPVPPGWKVGAHAVQLIGLALLAVAATYVLLCAISRRRSWTVRGHQIELPSTRMALLQLAVSSLNWLLIAAIVYVLLQQQVAYATVLGVLLVAAIAGVLTHVPAGLGVIEAVFVMLLGSQVPTHTLLAALLAYRALYYIAPLALAVLLYSGLEAAAARHPMRVSLHSG